MARISKDDIEHLGSAISLVIQQRYWWLFTHVARAIFLDALDRGAVETSGRYFFSEEDQSRGTAPIPIYMIADLLRRSDGYLGKDKENKYGYEFVRELTRLGTRGAFLLMAQAYLEHHRIETVIRNNAPVSTELFLFIRQARNVICHACSKMNDPRLRPCEWRGIRIENNGQELKLSDAQLNQLIEDAIDVMARLYRGVGGVVDYVSLNLGYTIPYIKQCADEMRQKG